MYEILDQIFRLILLIILAIFTYRHRNWKVAVVLALGLSSVLIGPENRSASVLALREVLAGFVVYLLIDYMQIANEARNLTLQTRLSAIVEGANVAIIGKTLDGEVVSWNKAAERLYGYNAAEIIGKNIRMLLPKNYPDDVKIITNKISRGEEVREWKTWRRRKDGKLVEVVLTVSPIYNQAGKNVGASVIAHKVGENGYEKDDQR